jgi:hypothetical protein
MGEAGYSSLCKSEPRLSIGFERRQLSTQSESKLMLSLGRTLYFHTDSVLVAPYAYVVNGLLGKD